MKSWISVVGGLLLLAGVATPPLAAGAKPGQAVKLTWYGQSCFLVESPGGTRVLMDPLPDTIGYELPPPLKADVVTVSHDHFDHNNLALAKGSPRVLRGPLAPPPATVGDVEIRAVGAFHDNVKGRKRGPDVIFLLRTGGLTLAHLGDLGQHELTAAQRSALAGVQVVLVPVGGVYTVDGAQAVRIVRSLPALRLAVPMHYKTAKLTIPLQPADPFLAAFPGRVGRQKSPTVEIRAGTLPPQLSVLVPAVP